MTVFLMLPEPTDRISHADYTTHFKQLTTLNQDLLKQEHRRDFLLATVGEAFKWIKDFKAQSTKMEEALATIKSKVSALSTSSNSEKPVPPLETSLSPTVFLDLDSGDMSALYHRHWTILADALKPENNAICKYSEFTQGLILTAEKFLSKRQTRLTYLEYLANRIAYFCCEQATSLNKPKKALSESEVFNADLLSLKKSRKKIELINNLFRTNCNIDLKQSIDNFTDSSLKKRRLIRFFSTIANLQNPDKLSVEKIALLNDSLESAQWSIRNYMISYSSVINNLISLTKSYAKIHQKKASTNSIFHSQLVTYFSRMCQLQTILFKNESYLVRLGFKAHIEDQFSIFAQYEKLMCSIL